MAEFDVKGFNPQVGDRVRIKNEFYTCQGEVGVLEKINPSWDCGYGVRMRQHDEPLMWLPIDQIEVVDAIPDSPDLRYYSNLYLGCRVQVYSGFRLTGWIVDMTDPIKMGLITVYFDCGCEEKLPSTVLERVEGQIEPVLHQCTQVAEEASDNTGTVCSQKVILGTKIGHSITLDDSKEDNMQDELIAVEEKYDAKIRLIKRDRWERACKKRKPCKANIKPAKWTKKKWVMCFLLTASILYTTTHFEKVSGWLKQKSIDQFSIKTGESTRGTAGQ